MPAISADGKKTQIFFEFPPVSFILKSCLLALSSLSPNMMGFKGSCLAHERQVVRVVFIQTVSTFLTQSTAGRWRRVCGPHRATQAAPRLKKEWNPLAQLSPLSQDLIGGSEHSGHTLGNTESLKYIFSLFLSCTLLFFLFFFFFCI